MWCACEGKERARLHGLWELLREAEETWRQDGGTQEAQEDTGTDKVITDVGRPLALLAAFLQVGEHGDQLSAKI